MKTQKTGFECAVQKAKILNSILLFLSSLLFYFIVRLLSFFSTSFTVKIVFFNSLCFIGFNSNNSISQRHKSEGKWKIMEEKLNFVKIEEKCKSVDSARVEKSKRDSRAVKRWNYVFCEKLKRWKDSLSFPLASASHSCWLMSVITRMKTLTNLGGKKKDKKKLKTLHLFITKHHPFFSLSNLPLIIVSYFSLCNLTESILP